jgi:hypothetical protein
VDRLALEIIQDRYKEFASWKTKPTHQIRLETNNIGLVNCWEIQGSGGTEHHRASLVQLGDFFLRHGPDGHVGGIRCRGSLTLRASRTLGIGRNDITDDN